jgi:hypothetical protein
MVVFTCMPISEIVSRYWLWIGTVLLQISIVAVMLRRGLVARLPVFFGYNVYYVLRSCVLLGIIANYARWSGRYASTYWITAALGACVDFATLRELFSEFFREYSGLRRVGRIVLGCLGLALLGITVCIAVFVPAARVFDRLSTLMWVVSRSLVLIEVGLLLLLFLFASYFGVAWRNVSFGIALGFGVYASIELAAMAFTAHLGDAGLATFTHINRVGYFICLLIWLSYVAKRDSDTRLPRKPPPVEDLEGWNRVLVDLLHR